MNLLIGFICCSTTLFYFGNCFRDYSLASVYEICCIDDTGYEFSELCANITCPSHLSKRRTFDEHNMQAILSEYTLVSTTCGNWPCTKSFFSQRDKKRITHIYNSLRNEVASGKLRTTIGLVEGVPNMMKMHWKRQLDVDAQMVANECNDNYNTPLKKEQVEEEVLACEAIGSKIQNDGTISSQKQFIDKLSNYLLNRNILNDFSGRFFTRQLATFFGCGLVMTREKISAYIFFVCKFCSKETVMYPHIIYQKPRAECPSYAKDLDSTYPNLCESKKFEDDFDWVNTTYLSRLVCEIAHHKDDELISDPHRTYHRHFRYLQFDVSRVRFTKTETVFRFFSAHIIYLISLLAVFLFSRNLTSDREEPLLSVIGAT